MKDRLIYAKRPRRKDLFRLRLMAIAGCLLLSAFLTWFFINCKAGNPWLFWTLNFALLFKTIKMVHEWYHYWSPSVPNCPMLRKNFNVDILTTFCPGEPKEMVKETLLAMKAIRYPHENFLCDEGNDPELKAFCEQHGIHHVTREKKINAKAGNINNALNTVAKGEITVILDPDHKPYPWLIERTLPYFMDEKTGYVQSVQAYGNQHESLVARGAAEQTYHFYGPMMMCMNSYGTVQAIGANCVFRRSALDSIGGHAPGLSEDMHTAMQIHAKGWKSVYIPEILTRGLVPATIPSFYSQQLKWSRGTFDLLFRVLPGLWKNLSIKQKIHYLTIPFYFLSGLVTFIDIMVPVLALLFSDIAWNTGLKDFAFLFIPVLALNLLIRLYAQKFTLEKNERGFHLMGGFLKYGTWWIYLLGFIYSIINKKVPYIPTPKNDEPVNNLKLSIPNLVFAGLSVFAAWYGLKRDWTPFSISMAVFAGINALILMFMVFVAQEKLMLKIRNKAIKFYRHRVVQHFEEIVERAGTLTLAGLRKISVLLTIVFACLFAGYSFIDAGNYNDQKTEKILGGFFIGHQGLAGKYDIHSITIQQLDSVEKKFMLITDGAAFISLKLNNNLLRQLRSKQKDSVLSAYSDLFRNYYHPVMIELNIPDEAENTGDDSLFKATFQYLVTYFNQKGNSNLTWVFHYKNNYGNYFPGSRFCDWISVSVQEKIAVKDYENIRRVTGKFEKPVLIELQAYYKSEFLRLRNFKEIRGFLFSSDIKEIQINDLKKSMHYNPVWTQRKSERFSDYKTSFLKGTPGNFNLIMDGKPFYIKGVAYNLEHDWRDWNNPLTRKQLEKDFSRIREMGANTIRRYGMGPYDLNILNLAGEYKLKVIYGFWFDPTVDYYRDSMKVREYKEEALKAVKEFRNHPALLSWNVGNETWGLLKHHFVKPYLVEVRASYLKMVEEIAAEIHKTDPLHPVFSSMEHEEYQIPGEIAAYKDHAKDIDVICVNSYYKQQIETLKDLCYRMDSCRPYLVSEFGPRGYWNPFYNWYDQNKGIHEETDKEKASWYAHQWKYYIENNRGYNIGGVAYCWQDRMEGSYTWFGICDFKGRLKPTYEALKSVWAKKGPGVSLAVSLDNISRIMKPEEYIEIPVQLIGTEFEAMLLRKDDFRKAGKAEINPDQGMVRIKSPEKPGEYRLYLFASDQADRVTTVSVPIIVKL